MSAETSSSLEAETRPTHVRHWVIAVATLMSVLLYLDRFAVGIASEYIREDLRMTQTQMSWFLSAFFWSYALAQVPAGWFSDRFGSRRMLTIYILAWSAFTGLLGFAFHVWLILALRLLMGISQAGAYPTSAAMIRHWFPIRSRGTASSLVGLGGRFGAVLAPLLTAWLILVSVSGSELNRFEPRDVVNIRRLHARFDEQAIRVSPSSVLLKKILSRIDESDRERIESLANQAARDEEEIAQRKRSRTWKQVVDSYLEVFGPRYWVAVLSDTAPESPDSDFARSGVVDALSQQITRPDFFDAVDVGHLKLHNIARELLNRRETLGPLPEPESQLLNRLVLESAFPDAIRKLHGPGWRPTMIVYGVIGLVVALGFLVICRDTPKQHPWCNAAERNIIHDEATLAVMRTEPRDPEFPWQAMLTNVSLWGNSLMQFTTNVGWLFVVTWLPRYLDKVHGVSLVQQGIMTAVPSGVGILTLFVGGRWTDIAARRFGLKWGRRVPILLTRFSAAAGYGTCLLLSLMFDPAASQGAEFNWLPWGYVFGLSFAAASVDLGTPAVWAFAQDVGGKYTGSILGWANMWGNLGAAAAPLIYNAVLGEHPSLGQWNTMFGVCLIAFVISGLCALVIDATQPLVRESSA